jgi:hypothetical protein
LRGWLLLRTGRRAAEIPSGRKEISFGHQSSHIQPNRLFNIIIMTDIYNKQNSFRTPTSRAHGPSVIHQNITSGISSCIQMSMSENDYIG